MNFFQHQDEARRASRKLVVFFVLAVAATALGVYLAASFVFFWVESSTFREFRFWDLERFVVFAGGAILVIVAGSAYKLWRLSEGGDAVARLLGGRPLDPNTSDPMERRLLNVVEEMAIASGIPVPTVYLLDSETSINAFASGFTPQDAVVGVTRGTVEYLDRDELQGVVAHELSHVVNGDIHLNLRLMGLLHGILLIALIGYFILRTTVRASSRNRRGGAVALLPVVGLALVAIGYAGVFFGRLIKSAVSRQRELLADASAVQFTRNPFGVAGALKKIGGLTEGSLVMSPHAEQASHFFFSDGKLGKARRAFSGVTYFEFLATHPPLPERIRRIDPGWDGIYPKVEPLAPQPPPEAQAPPKSPCPFRLLPAALAAVVGTLDRAHLAYARRLLADVPERVRDAVHDPGGARAVVLALLADREPAIQNAQLQWLGGARDELLQKETKELIPLLAASPREVRLPLVDLALPSLKRLSRPQYQEFMELVDRFLRADRQIDLFEYMLTHVLERHLSSAFERSKPLSVQYYALTTLRKECSVLLSAVAHAGHKDGEEARRAFSHGARELDPVELELLPRAEAGLVGVREALVRLERVAPKLKESLMKSFLATVAHDGELTVGEGEILRALADALGLPMPPLLPGQTIEAPAVASSARADVKVK